VVREIDQPYKKLAFGILLQSWRDIAFGDALTALDALVWFMYSRQCEFLCDMCGLRKRPIDLLIMGRVPTRFPSKIQWDITDTHFGFFGEDMNNDRITSNDKLG